MESYWNVDAFLDKMAKCVAMVRIYTIYTFTKVEIRTQFWIHHLHHASAAPHALPYGLAYLYPHELILALARNFKSAHTPHLT